MTLCEKLAELRGPKIKMHKDKLQSRELVCEVAIANGIDLPAIKYYGKVMMGRGLLDAWNIVYKRVFGDTIGTAGEAEVRRRNLVTKLCKERDANLRSSVG